MLSVKLSVRSFKHFYFKVKRLQLNLAFCVTCTNNNIITCIPGYCSYTGEQGKGREGGGGRGEREGGKGGGEGKGREGGGREGKGREGGGGGLIT